MIGIILIGQRRNQRCIKVQEYEKQGWRIAGSCKSRQKAEFAELPNVVDCGVSSIKAAHGWMAVS